MKLRIGDTVSFLNEVGQGTITRFKDKDTVFVEMKGITIVVSQVCYMCAVLVDVQDIEYAFIPKKNARIKYEKYSPQRHPRKQG